MLSKFRLLFVESWCLPIVAFNLFASLIVFISTFIQVKFFPDNSLANILFVKSINSIDLTIPTAFLLAIISILLFTLSNMLKFNSSLNDAFGGLAAITGLMGFLHILFSGILSTTPLFFIYDIQQIFRFAFLRTLEYSFVSGIYLCSILGAYRIFYFNENE